MPAMLSQRRDPLRYTPTPGISTSTSKIMLAASPATTTRGSAQKAWGMRLVMSIKTAPNPMPTSWRLTSRSASP